MKFIYSPHKDYQEAKKMENNPQEYKDLSSVVWPNFARINKIKTFILGNLSILRSYYIWTVHQKEIKRTFKKHNLKIAQTTCYLYNFGCQGWFDIDTGTIHVRFSKSPNSDLI